MMRLKIFQLIKKFLEIQKYWAFHISESWKTQSTIFPCISKLQLCHLSSSLKSMQIILKVLWRLHYRAQTTDIFRFDFPCFYILMQGRKISSKIKHIFIRRKIMFSWKENRKHVISPFSGFSSVNYQKYDLSSINRTNYL